MEITCQQEKLHNGIRVLFIPVDRVDSVTFLTLIRSGARYESARENGLAHFAEHMFFRGTDKRPTSNDISREIDSIGAAMNGGTSHEITQYYIKSAKEHLETSVDVLADIILNSKFDQKIIDLERGVIIEEINMYRDDPKRHIQTLWQNLLYGDTPLGRGIAGRENTVKGLKRDDFVDFVKDTYGTDSLVLVVCGNFDQKEAKDLLEDKFSSLKSTSVREFKENDFKQSGVGVKIDKRDTDQAHLILGVRSFSRFHGDRYILGVLGAILGGGMSSRLFTEIRDKRGLGYYVGFDTSFYHDAGDASAFCGVTVGRVGEATKAILEQFTDLKNNLVDEEELTKAKEYLKGKMALHLEGTMNLASFYGTRETLEGGAVSPEEIVEKIEEVSREDIVRVAGEIFTNEGLNLALIGPFDGKETFIKELSLEK